MTSLVLAGLLLLLGSPAATASRDTCACARARATNGWCGLHGTGYVAGVRVASARLHDAVDAHGHQVDPTTFPCPSCRTALAGGGYCEEHRLGFVDGDAYFSRLTWLLARAEPREDRKIRCRACRAHARDSGWCGRHALGMVGPFAFARRADFDAAVAEVEILKIANRAASRCEDCAIAIFTDTECPRCRIAYREGKPLSRS